MMSSYKRFVDSVFYSIDINEFIERRKCRATGKMRFNGRAEAIFFIHWIKWRLRKYLENPDRRKHGSLNIGAKAAPRYTYYCELCDGYHITKKPPYDYQQKKEKNNRKYFG